MSFPRGLSEHCADHVGLLPNDTSPDGPSDFIEGPIRIVEVSKVDADAVGGGGFADIWRGQLPSGELVALKVARVMYQGARLCKLLAREVHIWSQLHHRNVLPFLGLNIQPTSRPLCLVSPWMAHGHINDYLNAYPTADRIQLIRGIANGLSYIHIRNVIHGDLKGANILVNSFGEPLLADFGLSCIQDELEEEQGQTMSLAAAGSSRWRAPERFIPEKYGLTHRTSCRPPSDIYSLGMTIYEIMSGCIPFKGVNETSVAFLVMQGRRPHHPGDIAVQRGLHHMLWNFVIQSWRSSPQDRPTLHDLNLSLCSEMVELFEHRLDSQQQFPHGQQLRLHISSNSTLDLAQAGLRTSQQFDQVDIPHAAKAPQQQRTHQHAEPEVDDNVLYSGVHQRCGHRRNQQEALQLTHEMLRVSTESQRGRFAQLYRETAEQNKQLLALKKELLVARIYLPGTFVLDFRHAALKEAEIARLMASASDRKAILKELKAEIYGQHGRQPRRRRLA